MNVGKKAHFQLHYIRNPIKDYECSPEQSRRVPARHFATRKSNTTPSPNPESIYVHTSKNL